ncbi:BZ3500_MvSof-1268-A1-R1_Chr11-2g03339 [Microbotryum saponariae]|uniref:Phytase A n=1 Tax=Microbotryum saponariae TaxID=289078 RepID=A0A2X0NDK0_9BASI|nr:BZ3500_MvSof-1268-A1-R1_Chr11-2g03339 [Microbotryum saponariae]SDA03157.1 BZ3501_MvSof-1269-A2-R1_Chr11g02910 [Microbotryum saponariae]
MIDDARIGMGCESVGRMKELPTSTLMAVRKKSDTHIVHKMLFFDRKTRRPRRAPAAAIGLAILGGLCTVTGVNAAAALKPYWYGLEYMAQYSPFHSLEGWKKTGKTVDITGVYILQTNGASDPTASLSAAMHASVKKVAGRANYTVPEMRFLGNYTYKLGSDGAIMPFGKTQSNEAGYSTSKRYDCGESKLGEWPCWPFIRASNSPRVVESAKQWLAGYERDADDEAGKLGIHVISEAKDSKNTLLDTCSNLVSSVPSAQEQWRKVWTPAIIQRLQVSENFGLTDLDIVHFGYLCAFESLANGGISPFCNLFRTWEHQYIEYDGDLDKYYEHSYGTNLAGSQGVGWVRELLSRLTRDRSYVEQDTTQVNHTIDSNADLFPLRHDSMMYADFTHDDQLLAVLTLLGFFEDGPLSTTLPCPMRTFVASKMVPFSGRLVVERIQGIFVEGWSQIMSDKYVRILVNDQVMNLEKLCGKSNVFEKGTYCSMWQFVSVMEGLANTAAEEFKRC